MLKINNAVDLTVSCIQIQVLVSSNKNKRYQTNIWCKNFSSVLRNLFYNGLVITIRDGSVVQVTSQSLQQIILVASNKLDLQKIQLFWQILRIKYNFCTVEKRRKLYESGNTKNSKRYNWTTFKCILEDLCILAKILTWMNIANEGKKEETGKRRKGWG